MLSNDTYLISTPIARAFPFSDLGVLICEMRRLIERDVLRSFWISWTWQVKRGSSGPGRRRAISFGTWDLTWKTEKDVYHNAK